MHKISDYEYLPLNALRAFEVAARYESFARAADTLCVTQAAVSQQVTQLEDRLGVLLFFRQHRRIRLTDEGRALATVLQQSFERIASAVRQVKRSRQNARLKLVLYPTIAIRWLIPRLARFHDAHPDIEVQITTSMQEVDFSNDDVDFSILYFGTPPKNVEVTPLLKEVFVPVCSPRLVDGRTILAEELINFTLIHSTNRLSDWPAWLDYAGVVTKPTGPELFFGNSYLAYQAAIDGLGVAMAQVALIEQDLADGRLMIPVPIQYETNRTYYLTYPANRKNLEKVVLFRDWISNEIGKPIVRAQVPPRRKPTD